MLRTDNYLLNSILAGLFTVMSHAAFSQAHDVFKDDRRPANDDKAISTMTQFMTAKKDHVEKAAPKKDSSINLYLPATFGSNAGEATISKPLSKSARIAGEYGLSKLITLPGSDIITPTRETKLTLKDRPAVSRSSDGKVVPFRRLTFTS